MRERMEQIWGSLEVSSSPGTGTTVTACLALGQASGPGKSENAPSKIPYPRIGAFSYVDRDSFVRLTSFEVGGDEDDRGFRHKLSLFAVGCFLLAGQLAFGQTFGSIGGEARDSTGAVVAGAVVTAVNTGTNASRSAVTNDAGAYAFPSLPPGTYTVKVEKAGFKTVVRNQIELQVQLAARVDFELQIGQVSESVEVRADAALLVTDNATVGTVIENKRIVELPLNGRNYLQLVSLAPNVSTGFSSQGQAGARQGGIRAAQTISVAGQRTNFNHYTLDGVENTDPNFNTFVVMPSIDALQEFKVQTGVYPAEFGRQTTQINVLTKSGTNQYHGTLFEFLRNDKLDANLTRSLRSGPTKDPFKWNQYGCHAGRTGPAAEDLQRQGQAVLHGELRGLPETRQHHGLYSLAPAAIQGGDFSAYRNKIYDPDSHALAADGKTITATRSRAMSFRKTGSARFRKSCWSSTTRRRCPAL